MAEKQLTLSEFIEGNIGDPKDEAALKDMFKMKLSDPVDGALLVMLRGEITTLGDWVQKATRDNLGERQLEDPNGGLVRLRNYCILYKAVLEAIRDSIGGILGLTLGEMPSQSDPEVNAAARILQATRYRKEPFAPESITTLVPDLPKFDSQALARVKAMVVAGGGKASEEGGEWKVNV